MNKQCCITHTHPHPYQGFPSTVRVPGADPPPPPAALAEDSALMLGFAWTLVAMCCLHHAGHALHDLGFHAVAHLPLLHAMGTPIPTTLHA